MAAGQHELLQKQANKLLRNRNLRRVAAGQQNRMESSAGWAVQRTPAFRRDEPAAADGQLCTGTGTTARRWRGGRQRGLGSRLPDHWNRFDPELLRTSIASKPPRCQPAPPLAVYQASLHTPTSICTVNMPVAACGCRSCCAPASPRPLLVSGFCVICVTLRLHVTQRQQQRTIESCTRELHADSCCSAEVGPRPLPREPAGAST